MARPRRQVVPNTKDVLAFDVGGEWKSGDPRKMPKGKVRLAHNLFHAPGRLEARPPWRLAGSPPAGSANAFFSYNDRSLNRDVLCFGRSDATTIHYLDSAGSYVSVSGAASNVHDSSNLDNKAYFTAGTHGTLYSFNGSAVSAGGQDGLYGKTVESFVRRIFAGNVTLGESNKALNTTVADSIAFGHDDATYWTAATMSQPTLAGDGVKVTFSATASSDTLTTTSAVFTTGAAEGKVTFRHDFLSNEPTDTISFVMRITDGTNTLAERTVRLPSKTVLPEWSAYAVTALVPASTTVYLQIAGDANTPNSAEMYVADRALIKGAMVTEGALVFDKLHSSVSTSTVNTAYPYRFYWSETDNTDDWLATSYYDCVEVPGPITLLRAANDRLWAFKEDAVWGFRPTGRDVPAIVQEKLHKGFGCVGTKAYDTYGGESYFVGLREIYKWDHSSPVPEELAGPGMREEMFDGTNFLGSDSVLEIDHINKRIFCYTQPGTIYVYNMEMGDWTEIDVEAGLNIKDLLFVKALSTSAYTMWTIADIAGNTGISNLDDSGTKDFVDGVETDVVKKVWLRPVGTSAPRSTITIDEVGFDHEISGTQTDDEIRVSGSNDGGNTFSYYNEARIATLSAGAGDTKREWVPVQRSGENIMLEIKHTGRTGPTYFNISGGDVHIRTRGREIPANKPTQVANTL